MVRQTRLLVLGLDKWY